MIERRSPLRMLALGASIGLASCAQSSMNAPASSPAEPAAAPAVGGAMPAESNDLEGQIAALTSAEARLNEVLGSGDEIQLAKPVTPLPQKDKREVDATSGNKKGAEQLSQGDACSTACSALSSMERATLHLCGLAGESDRRCEEAKARVQIATSRVRASCPVCATR
jgi:hypothetical protein